MFGRPIALLVLLYFLACKPGCSSGDMSIAKGTLGVRQQAQARLVPVTVTADPNSVTLPGLLLSQAASGNRIHIELPGRRR